MVQLKSGLHDRDNCLITYRSMLHTSAYTFVCKSISIQVEIGYVVTAVVYVTLRTDLKTIKLQQIAYIKWPIILLSLFHAVVQVFENGPLIFSKTVHFRSGCYCN